MRETIKKSTVQKKLRCSTWPEILNIQLDNASGENKNNILFAFAGYLVKIGMFKQVNIDFMIPGHTHDKCDQYFSLVSRFLHTNDARCFSELIQALVESHQRPCK